MAFTPVMQVHTNGCFIAATAMLLGKSYHDTCRLFQPRYKPGDHMNGLKSNHIVRDTKKALLKLGCSVRIARTKDVKKLQESHKHALLIMRWGGGKLCHAVVFDGETKQFLDPVEHTVTKYNIKEYQRNLESILYVEPPTYMELAA